MKKAKIEMDPNILVEKQKFYVSEFEQETAWLSFMHKDGWKLLSTDGYRYQFEKTEKENWSYQMDFKPNGTEEEDYLQMYRDFGWEYVGTHNGWFYFRKMLVEGETTDTTLFGDRESKLELCKRIVNGQFLRMLPIILFLPLLINALNFLKILEITGLVFGIIISIFSILSLLFFLLACFIYLNQIFRLNKMIKELGGTEQ